MHLKIYIYITIRVKLVISLFYNEFFKLIIKYCYGWGAVKNYYIYANHFCKFQGSSFFILVVDVYCATYVRTSKYLHLLPRVRFVSIPQHQLYFKGGVGAEGEGYNTPIVFFKFQDITSLFKSS